jgi:pimeloyl-ACP methyl ester carboxylesterase
MSLPIAADVPEAPKHPILFLHGVNGHANQFDGIIKRVRSLFNDDAPPMHSIGICDGSCSLRTPLVTQRAQLIRWLTKNSSQMGLEGGFHLVAHSQGALLARSVVQMLPAHLKIRTFASMAGPQKGQYGMCTMSKSGLGPDLGKAMARPAGWIAFYNPIAQNEISIANYWNDPDHSWAFRHGCDFLPEVNGYVDNGTLAAQKRNFLRLNKAVFVGSSGDDCINPPLSSVFEYVDGHSSPTTRAMSKEYADDTFGLRTMAVQGRAIFEKPAGYKHMDWVRVEEGKLSLFEEYILPHLD